MYSRILKINLKNNSVGKPYTNSYIALVLNNSGENLWLEIQLTTLLR